MPALKADFAQPEVQTSDGASSAVKPRPEILINNEVSIPPEVVDLDTFCNWTCSEDYPNHGQLCYLAGLVWVDLTMEELYGHSFLKAEFTSVLAPLAKKSQKGRFAPDGMWMKNEQADLSTEPDGMYVSYDAFRSGRVQRVKSPKGIIFQLSGTPEMVLEILSTTSEVKDTKRLYKLYGLAGIPEYWLVDARGDKPRFDIYRHGPKGYTATPRQVGGWLKSAVFGQSFRLTREDDPLGDPLYNLEVR